MWDFFEVGRGVGFGYWFSFEIGGVVVVCKWWEVGEGRYYRKYRVFWGLWLIFRFRFCSREVYRFIVLRRWLFRGEIWGIS